MQFKWPSPFTRTPIPDYLLRHLSLKKLVNKILKILQALLWAVKIIIQELHCTGTKNQQRNQIKNRSYKNMISIKILGRDSLSKCK